MSNSGGAAMMIKRTGYSIFVKFLDRVCNYLFLASVILLFATPAEAQKNHIDEISTLELFELETRLKQAATYRLLRDVKQSIDADARCAEPFRKARDTRNALIALNRQFRSNPTVEYQRRARQLKQDNQREIDRYKACFGFRIIEFEEALAVGVDNYERHRTKFGQMSDAFDDVAGDIDGYIRELEREIEALNGSGDRVTVATLLGASGGEVLRGGRGSNWVPAFSGMQLNVTDKIRTGNRERLRIRIRDRTDKSGTKGTIIHFGSDSEMMIDSFRIVQQPQQPERHLAVRIIRGLFRAISKGWGEKSTTQFGTGLSILGIRGTEVVVSYDPGLNKAEYHLVEGDAYSVVNNIEKPMKPATSIAIVNGRAEPLRRLTQSELTVLMARTSTGQSLAGFSSQPAQSSATPVAQQLPPLQRAPLAGISNLETAQHRSARLSADLFLSKLKAGDGSAALRLIKRNSKSDTKYREIVRNQSFGQVLTNKGIRPVRFQPRCSYCIPGTNGCLILLDVLFEGKGSPYLGQYMVNVEEGEERWFQITNDIKASASAEQVLKQNTSGSICGALP